jgi:dihydropteroate synthase
MREQAPATEGPARARVPATEGPPPSGVTATEGPARARGLRIGDRELALGGRPLLMGVVNASPDSFSDAGASTGLGRQRDLARELAAAGADILDVGGESARTDTPGIGAEEEIERVVPLIGWIVRELGVIVSVDTYKPAVAKAAIAAGARIVNDVSGLRDPELASVCADTGAALVLMHTVAAPKQRLQDPERYKDVSAEVMAFLEDRIEVALGEGAAFEQLIVDPGPDFAKTPSQTIEVLRDLESLHGLGRPILMAISRKDFIGALTDRAPRERLAGTLAALGHGVERGAHIFRVHDVGAAADFLAVHGALAGELGPDRDLALADGLRHESPPGLPADQRLSSPGESDR